MILLYVVSAFSTIVLFLFFGPISYTAEKDARFRQGGCLCPAPPPPSPLPSALFFPFFLLSFGVFFCLLCRRLSLPSSACLGSIFFGDLCRNTLCHIYVLAIFRFSRICFYPTSDLSQGVPPPPAPLSRVSQCESTPVSTCATPSPSPSFCPPGQRSNYCKQLSSPPPLPPCSQRNSCARRWRRLFPCTDTLRCPTTSRSRGRRAGPR